MERISPPDSLVHSVDFTLSDVCERCPLRRPELEAFDPAYGVIIDSDESTTDIVIVNFEAEWDRKRGRPGIQSPRQKIVLKTGDTYLPSVQSAFDDCEDPVVLQRRCRSDQIICSALNRILTKKVPTSRNLKVYKTS